MFFFYFPASYGTGSGTVGGREILVQHLLVKEDDQKLLLDLQQRISAGLELDCYKGKIVQ